MRYDRRLGPLKYAEPDAPADVARGHSGVLRAAPAPARQVRIVTGATIVRVLVVDDDVAIRRTLRAALEDEGYKVQEAAEGAQALAALHESAQPLVVLLDLRMPGVDGEVVLRTVASDPALAGTHRFIMVTANRDAISPSLAGLMARMSVPLVAKPFDLDELLELVAEVAEGTDSRELHVPDTGGASSGPRR